MTLKQLTIVPMLALSLFAVGCGADCESLCEDMNECEGVEADEKQDCGKTCEEDIKGCEDQSDDVVDCMGDLDDICKFDATKDCQSELTALGACINKE